MNKEELKVMIDETINSNGARNITGKALNLALTAIVDAMGTSSGSEDDGKLKRNDVNFFDYDGTLLYAYTWEEAKELTELPPLPVHDGLEVREWNYTLEDIKAQGTETTIGKADVGACVYDSNGEQMLDSNVLIIERGETELYYYSEEIFSVVSIPNTITAGGTPSFYACMFFGEVKLPISFNPTSWDNYSLICDCIVDNIYINGNPYQSNGYWYACLFRDIYRPQSSFTEIGRIPFDLSSNYYKMLPHISYINDIDFYYNDRAYWYIVDFSEYTYVPELGSVKYTNWNPNVIIVPDELHDEWINTTNWANIADRIKPVSEYKNIIRK